MPVDARDPGGSAPDTVVEAIARLEADGYTDSFHIAHGELRSTARDQGGLVDVAVVEHFYRFEGASNPDDEAIVFGLFDPTTESRGTLVSGFGPSADPEEMDVLLILHRRMGEGD
jgi:hypothetical protein